jgi:AcrR family transcriptional regulator
MSSQIGDQQGEKRPRGRPRRIAEAAALEAAMRVFWRDGYAGTGIEALSRATGLNRSSLYHQWGDKQGLFLATIAHYAETRLQPVVATLDGGRTLAEDLSAFFAAVIDLALDERGARGCLVSCVLADAAGSDDRLRRELTQRFAAVEDRLARRLSLADHDETPPGAMPAVLAGMLAATARGIMLRARADASRATLQEIAGTTVALLRQPPVS